MIAYHGSNHKFSNLKIDRSNVNWDREHEHGLGIYFCTDKHTAQRYGKYLYVLDINDKYIKDFRNELHCIMFIDNLVNEVFKVTGVDLSNYINLNKLIYCMLTSELCIGTIYSDFDHELYYSEKAKALSKTKLNEINRAIRVYCKKELEVFLFESDEPITGLITKIDANTVRLVNI